MTGPSASGARAAEPYSPAALSKERLAEDIAFRRTWQAIVDQDQHGPFPWMLKSPEDVLRDKARDALAAAGFSDADVDEVICDHGWDW